MVHPLNSRFLNKEIETLGSTITIRAVTDVSNSKWGDESETTSDTASISCMVNVLDNDSELVKEGIFETGDKIFWIKQNVSNVSRGNRIQHNSKWYEILEVIEHEAGDTTYVLEARTKKV